MEEKKESEYTVSMTLSEARAARAMCEQVNGTITLEGMRVVIGLAAKLEGLILMAVEKEKGNAV